jgi:hypothetical protein
MVTPQDADAAGFRDGSEHRKDLPGPYNIYATTAGDPAYEREREDLQILYRPLFITSFMLDDFLSDNDFFGAERLIVSSASSKTAYGTAFCIELRDRHPSLVALTSPRNVEFTRSLGCYDEVITYESVDDLKIGVPSVYVDFAGNGELRARVHEHLGGDLVYDAVVGATHLDALGGSAGDLPGPDPTFFFAPDQIRKRRADWGKGGIEKRYGVSWRLFAPKVENWVDVRVGRGAEDLRAAWLDVLSGKGDPRAGHVIQL